MGGRKGSSTKIDVGWDAEGTEACPTTNTTRPLSTELYIRCPPKTHRIKQRDTIERVKLSGAVCSHFVQNACGAIRHQCSAISMEHPIVLEQAHRRVVHEYQLERGTNCYLYAHFGSLHLIACNMEPAQNTKRVAPRNIREWSISPRLT